MRAELWQVLEALKLNYNLGKVKSIQFYVFQYDSLFTFVSQSTRTNEHYQTLVIFRLILNYLFQNLFAYDNWAVFEDLVQNF